MAQRILSEIRSNTKRFELRRPIAVDLVQRGEWWLARHSPLGLESAGRSEEQALLTFGEEFDAGWDFLVEAPGNTPFTADARLLRDRLCELVARVTILG